MYRCIAESIKPQKLGPRGARKVRNMSRKVTGELWASSGDALELVAELERGNETVKWELDAENILRSIMWASPEQILLARTYGGVVIQDNTCLTNRYNNKLCLFVGVDSENKTQVFAQGFFSNESTEAFDFANKFFLDICGGHPKVIITDSDAAMKESIRGVFPPPHTTHLLCSWHICKNIKKKCLSILKSEKCADLLRRWTRASLATSIEAFDGVWTDVEDLVKGTDCEEYILKFLYERRKHWARCFHPTVMTLDMTSSQRVEGTFSVLKKGRVLRRNSTFRQVRAKCEQIAGELRLASTMQATKQTSLGKGYVENDVKKSMEKVMTAYAEVGASKYAKEEIWAEMLASSAYDTSIVTEGRDSMQFLQNLATRSVNDSNDSTNVSGHDHGAGDVCCQVPKEVFEEDEAPDTTMFGTTSLHSFCRLVECVEIDCIVKVLYKHKPDRKVGHLVIVGPGGFQLCTCLQLLRRGLQCRHVLAALVTRLKRSDEFKGQSIHPRWRSSVEPWSIAEVKLGTFDGDGDGSYDGGFTGDWEPSGDFEDLQGDNTSVSVLSVLRGRAFANLTELCNRAVRTYTDSMTRDSTTADQSMFGDLMRHVNDFVEKRRSGDTEESSFQV
ncbi:putative far-red impaired response protein [Ectocarpus siliculosus]|uniref:Far-red impaired response protein n=1 Tax=Ectocarpus siliculosus TaxID=2880 RepID=D7FLF6_ECTSI|nr:putative far-red impaired response protein [Ectocarpus siliculosus]|eukprot:CBJ29724.1 putative far-red impaired response protein [Ectocarpus siliculosus]